MKLLALIPALNAESTIGDVVRKTREQVHDVIVIDDGCSDRTADVARAEGATVLRHDVNRGKGASLKSGFAYAREHGYDAVITLDADGQHLPSEIPKIIKAWQENGADLVIGGRAHLFDHMLPRRRIANRFSAWAIAKAAGTRVSDSQSGFRLYAARLLREVDLRTDGFDMESEVIIRAGVRKMRIVVTPVDLGFIDGLSTSHYRPLGDTLRITWTAFRARFLWR
ncbi:MAG TPA: glycosyltransferase family 2 protein [Thermoanaerobaculia bacterium]|nr:glycosyltransferase family 2 protein [Thermoanaerobaculia bacterium]